MKFLPLRDFDTVTSALNFDTPDCHVTGGCDLYTTKAAGSDKKLYKNIDKSLESQHAALVQLGASLSPPRREEMAASLNLSRSSPFGPLSEISSRRTFAYLIATLNASHPDYDFSNVLRPQDFKRERNLKKVMNNLDSTLHSVRPGAPSLLDGSYVPRPSDSASTRSAILAGMPVGSSPAWGPHMWAMIDKEMALQECTIFSYQPVDDPFDEAEGAIWTLHYFFFHKALKRVAYVYVRSVPVVSHSPRMQAHHSGLSAVKRRALEEQPDDTDEDGASKRAKFWLGERYADRVATSYGEDSDEMDDGFLWNRGPNGDFDEYGRYDEEEDDYYDDDDDDENMDEDDMRDEEEKDKQDRKSPPRGVSEDIASRMEFDI